MSLSAPSRDAVPAVPTGRLPALNTIPTSSYVEYLPAPFHADPFVGRFLMIIETILSSIEGTVDNIPNYFDPMVTPEEFLPWLSTWVGVELDQNTPVAKRRRAIATAASLYRWQGTRRALRERIKAYTGHTPLIVENCDGMRLGQDAALGVNTRLGQSRPHTLAITAPVDAGDDIDTEVLRRIVDAEKPAHVTYTMQVLSRRQRADRRGPGPDPDSDAPPPAPIWVIRTPAAVGVVPAAPAAPKVPAAPVAPVASWVGPAAAGAARARRRAIERAASSNSPTPSDDR